MDKRTERKLQDLTRRATAPFLKNLIKSEKPMDETRRILEDAAMSGRLNLATRKKVREMLQNKDIQKSFSRVSTSINPETELLLEKKVDLAIARAKKRGLLPEPDMREYNAYMKKIHKGKL